MTGSERSHSGEQGAEQYWSWATVYCQSIQRLSCDKHTEHNKHIFDRGALKIWLSNLVKYCSWRCCMLQHEWGITFATDGMREGNGSEDINSRAPLRGDNMSRPLPAWLLTPCCPALYLSSVFCVLTVRYAHFKSSRLFFVKLIRAS